MNESRRQTIIIIEKLLEHACMWLEFLVSRNPTETARDDNRGKF